MRRFFLGANMAKGFASFYESELAGIDNVVLLKGAPGTGKSTLIKRIAERAARMGVDCEMWQCSGDPASADGVYLEELSAAVVDATSPHPCEAALPVIRERTIDMAAALDREKLLPFKSEVKELLKRKKTCYAYAYEHLKRAYWHYECAKRDFAGRMGDAEPRRLAAAFALREEGGTARGRNAFFRAHTPDGETAYTEWLSGKRVYLLEGGELAAKAFTEEAARLIPGAFVLHDPLCAEEAEALFTDEIALVRGVAGVAVYERIEVGKDGAKEALTERDREIALAHAMLAEARKAHERIESMHLSAMDISVTEELGERVSRMIFGE